MSTQPATDVLSNAKLPASAAAARALGSRLDALDASAFAVRLANMLVATGGSDVGSRQQTVPGQTIDLAHARDEVAQDVATESKGIIQASPLQVTADQLVMNKECLDAVPVTQAVPAQAAPAASGDASRKSSKPGLRQASGVNASKPVVAETATSLAHAAPPNTNEPAPAVPISAPLLPLQSGGGMNAGTAQESGLEEKSTAIAPTTAKSPRCATAMVANVSASAAPTTAKDELSSVGPVAPLAAHPQPEHASAANGAGTGSTAEAASIAAAASPVPSMQQANVERSTSATAADQTAPAPVHQAAAAVVGLASAGGSQRLTLRLAPAELGQVEIQIDRPKDGPASVALTVQRPETLVLLLRDQTELHKALDQAGLPVDGRTLSLHLAQSDAAPSGLTSAPQATSFGSEQAMTNGGGTRNGQQSQGRTPRSLTASGDKASGAAAVSSSPSRWLRAGVDITA